MNDPHDLDRFVLAQADVFATALAEIRRCAKRSHWMWFVFPQLAGLGRSDMARRYAIRSLDEARAYIAHPVLGARLRESVGALQDLTGLSAEAVFGGIDAVKLRSSLTLFREAGGGPLFAAALELWFDGPAAPDSRRELFYKTDWSPPQMNRNRQTGVEIHKSEGNNYAARALTQALGLRGRNRSNWSCCHMGAWTTRPTPRPTSSCRIQGTIPASRTWCCCLRR